MVKVEGIVILMAAVLVIEVKVVEEFNVVCATVVVEDEAAGMDTLE